MNAPLSPRQKDVLALIERSIAERGYPPTRPEISAALGATSPNAAEQHLRALERKGYIAILPVARGIRVLKPTRVLPVPRRAAANDERVLRLPLIGRVAAGQPILAEQSIEDELALDPQLFTPTPDFLLRVRGDSMRDAGIHDGDFVAVARGREAANGQIVVARIDDEATVKTFERKAGRIRLLPANPDYAPIDVDGDLVIEGRVVGVIRRSP
ncbi:MAG TPA: transcriptional repressor LexA [Pseudomonadota bacterium]|jgi:repressor LexA|nr:transcriptional repressor LexA [Pseudomonadota bacterium]